MFQLEIQTISSLCNGFKSYSQRLSNIYCINLWIFVIKHLIFYSINNILLYLYRLFGFLMRVSCQPAGYQVGQIYFGFPASQLELETLNNFCPSRFSQVCPDFHFLQKANLYRKCVEIFSSLWRAYIELVPFFQESQNRSLHMDSS